MSVDRRPGAETEAGRDLGRRIRAFWELDADVYDRSPSHHLEDLVEAAAWRRALDRHLPPPGAKILDVGAGTGAMSLLAAELGFRVTALDFSPAMLARAQQKAAARGLQIEFVVGGAQEPPPGPFDAVIERHVLWTQPDPVEALRAWRSVAPRGRVVLYEGLWGHRTLGRRVRSGLARHVRRALRRPSDHHAEYDPDVVASLPLARAPSVDPFIEALGGAGWRRYRLESLRDVDRARRRAQGWPLGWLEGVPQFALLAEA